MDRFVADFQRLRHDAGDVSYGEIAQRVQRLREQRGVPASASYVGRSTVYDVFRTGRRRINSELVAVIATVLGEDEAAVAEWRRASVRARNAEVAATKPTDPHPPAPTPQPAPPPLAPLPTTPATPSPRVRMMLVAFASAVIVLGATVNLLGSSLAVALSLPLYLDMIGTAIVAIAVGPWYGVAVAVLTHGGHALAIGQTDGIPFMLVNITGALIWGYGVRKFQLGSTPLRFFTLTLLTAFGCTLVATPVIVLVYGGTSTNAGAESIAGYLALFENHTAAAVFSANILTSTIDKLIAGFIALVIAPLLMAAMPVAERRRPDLFGSHPVAASERSQKAE